MDSTTAVIYQDEFGPSLFPWGIDNDRLEPCSVRRHYHDGLWAMSSVF